jgi:signal transduction histidine kinase
MPTPPHDVVAVLRASSSMSTLDIDELAWAALDAVQELGYPLAVFGLVEDGGARVREIASVGFTGVTRGTSVAAGDGLAGRCIASGRTETAYDYGALDRTVDQREMVRSAVSVPVLVDGEPVAVIQAAESEPGAPPAWAVEALETVAEHAARAIATGRRVDREVAGLTRSDDLEELREHFLSNVSHELRRPLSVVIAAATALRHRRDALSAEATDQLLDRIVDQGWQLDGSLRALLTLERVRAGAVQIRREPVDLAEIARRTVDRIAELGVSRDVGLEVARVEVDGDADLLGHVAENLLANAFTHTPEGTAIRMVVLDDDGYGCLQVLDDGAGLDTDELDRITHRFRRGAGSVLGRDGSGIGLALSSEILAAHGTRLEVESAPGEGASFGFRLPVRGTR